MKAEECDMYAFLVNHSQKRSNSLRMSVHHYTAPTIAKLSHIFVACNTVNCSKLIDPVVSYPEYKWLFKRED